MNTLPNMLGISIKIYLFQAIFGLFSFGRPSLICLRLGESYKPIALKVDKNKSNQFDKKLRGWQKSGFFYANIPAGCLN